MREIPRPPWADYHKARRTIGNGRISLASTAADLDAVTRSLQAAELAGLIHAAAAAPLILTVDAASPDLG